MGRLTITLDGELHQALKETAARQRRSITAIIAESLRFRGIRRQSNAQTLVAAARQSAALDAAAAMEIALAETSAHRQDQ